MSFGQNIIDKNTTRIYLVADKFGGEDQYATDVIPTIVYGLTDSSSIALTTPIAASYNQNKEYSSGLEDSAVQMEYAVYASQNNAFSDQATVVTNVSFPTGSTRKQPVTGLGSPSYFLGATYTRLYVNWYGFTSEGIMLISPKGQTPFGYSFLYQFGLGRNIFDISNRWIIAALLELDGQDTQEDRVKINLNAGNLAYLTPSLWISSKRLIIQGGFGFPVIQNLKGDQNKNNYLVAGSLSWTFG